MFDSPLHIYSLIYDGRTITEVVVEGTELAYNSIFGAASMLRHLLQDLECICTISIFDFPHSPSSTLIVQKNRSTAIF